MVPPGVSCAQVCRVLPTSVRDAVVLHTVRETTLTKSPHFWLIIKQVLQGDGGVDGEANVSHDAKPQGVAACRGDVGDVQALVGHRLCICWPLEGPE